MRYPTCVKGLWLSSALFVIAVLSWSAPANAMNIQQINSPGGIKAWLVEDHSVPIISLRFGFRGGSAQDPADRQGVAYFLSGMLDEGAGELTSTAFQEKMQELAVRLSFDASRDFFYGHLQTLTQNKDEAFDLLRLALSKPRFDADAVERIRKQIGDGLKFEQNDPAKVASKAWFKTAFKDHPYARAVKGTAASIDAIVSADLKAYATRILARETLTVAVVGDIDAATLGLVLDKIFANLPEKANLKDVPEATPPTGPVHEVISMDVPQSVAEFGSAGLKRKDPDFIPAYILNYIMGGGGFSSRLTEEVREKRGLAYSVYSYLYPYRHGAAYIGNVATQNKAMGQSLKVICGELTRMANEGPSAEELENAKRYLTGSYALRFDTSSKISQQLLWVQIEDLGQEYFDERNKLIEAVTLDDLKRVAKRVLQPENLIVTIVGNPEGLEQTNATCDVHG